MIFLFSSSSEYFIALSSVLCGLAVFLVFFVSDNMQLITDNNFIGITSRCESLCVCTLFCLGGYLWAPIYWSYEMNV